MNNMRYSHYDWLHENFYQFLINLGVDKDYATTCTSCIGAPGDKCYGYEWRFKEAGIPFEHGVAVFLLTYIRPWGLECRETKNGWVDPCTWVIENFEKFKKFLPEVIGQRSCK